MVEPADVPDTPASNKRSASSVRTLSISVLDALLNGCSLQAAKRPEVRMLEYEELPGMLTNSAAYRKAKATVLKGAENKSKKAKLNTNDSRAGETRSIPFLYSSLLLLTLISAGGPSSGTSYTRASVQNAVNRPRSTSADEEVDRLLIEARHQLQVASYRSEIAARECEMLRTDIGTLQYSVNSRR